MISGFQIISIRGWFLVENLTSYVFFLAVAASVFGEQRRLQPMAPEQKARWTKEIDWLLSVADFIVEFVPSRQVAEDGSTMEVSKESPTPIFITHG